MKCRDKSDPASSFTCWKYDPNAPIPLWVARKFHKLTSANVMTGIFGEILVEVFPGDWLLRLDFDEEGQSKQSLVFNMSAAEFEASCEIISEEPTQCQESPHEHKK